MTNKTTNSFIQVNDIVLRFKKDILLDHVSYQCEHGKIHGIVGRNGSGKTMLMKCICGFIPVTSGKVTVFGKVIGKDVDIPDNIGAIIETPGFLPEYSAYRNLKFLADINGKASKENIRNAMQSVGLDPDSRKHVGKFSLGMRQRLGLAQAIMEDPDLLILDEPMNGLDKDGVQDMRSYLLHLKEQGKTILLASHSAEDISVLCDTVCEMDKGKLTIIS